jgi:hypothetical protein
MIENVYYRKLPWAHAAREAMIKRKTNAHDIGDLETAFLAGFLQGAQHVTQDKDVQSCPNCGSLFVHMSQHASLRLNDDVKKIGDQYEKFLDCEFTCRSCNENWAVQLKVSAL